MRLTIAPRYSLAARNAPATAAIITSTASTITTTSITAVALIASSLPLSLARYLYR